MVLKSSKWFRNVQNGFEKFKMVLRIRNSFEKTHFKIVLGRNYIGIFLRSAGHKQFTVFRSFLVGTGQLLIVLDLSTSLYLAIFDSKSHFILATKPRLLSSVYFSD